MASIGKFVDMVKETNETDGREAKRIAAISESMAVIRTLNSHNISFEVRFSKFQIYFLLPYYTQQQIQDILPDIKVIGGSGASIEML